MGQELLPAQHSPSAFLSYGDLEGELWLSPQCLSTSHIPAQGCGEENQHLSYSYLPRIFELFTITSSQTNEENDLPNPTALHAQCQP